MTISEATEQGIQRLTRKEWNPTAYIELYFIDSEEKRYSGPWVTLHDPASQSVLGTGPQKVFFGELPTDGWGRFEK
jgi:hypothetical protein